MIWYTEEIKVKGQPEDSSVMLVGKFLPSRDLTPPITISVIFSDTKENTVTEMAIILFSHTPNLYRDDMPLVEDIFDKYKTKLIKAKRKIENALFSELVSLKPFS